MKVSRLFDREEDFAQVSVIVDYVSSEKLDQGLPEDFPIEELKAVASRSRPLPEDPGERDRLTAAFHELHDRYRRHMGLAGLFSDRTKDEIPTIPPPGTTSAAPIMPALSAENIEEQANATVRRASGMTRTANTMAGGPDKIEFMRIRFNKAITQLFKIKQGARTFPDEGRIKAGEFIERVKADLDVADRILLLNNAAEWVAIATDLIARVNSQVEQGLSPDPVLVFLVQKIEVTGVAGKISSMRLELLEAYLRAEKPYPDVFADTSYSRRQMISDIPPPKEPPPIRDEIPTRPDLAAEAERRNRTPTLSSEAGASKSRPGMPDMRIINAMGLCLTVGQGFSEDFAVRHAENRQRQLTRIESIGMTDPKIADLVKQITADLETTLRIGNINKRLDEALRALVMEVHKEMKTAKEMIKNDAEAALDFHARALSIIELYGSIRSNLSGFQNLRNELLIGHIAAASIITPYAEPTGRGGADPRGGNNTPTKPPPPNYEGLRFSSPFECECTQADALTSGGASVLQPDTVGGYDQVSISAGTFFNDLAMTGLTSGLVSTRAI